ncbi:MAG: hypothetical protein AAF579_23165 [Cyanobacteria bacterium P01_C01_bin.118]
MMIQLVAFLLVVAALVILVLQNLSPVIPLVVLGQSVGSLPLSLWILGAIAIGILCTLVIYQLVPSKRAYRPMGKRLSDPVPPEPTHRFVDTPDAGSSTQFQQPPANDTPSQNPYDSDWENFQAPEQWDDWGQRAAHSGQESSARRPNDTRGTSTDDAMRDIESGWGDEDYQPDPRRASYRDRDPYGQEDNPDIGWPRSEPPQQQTYNEGWLYGNEADDEPTGSNEPGAPEPDEESEDVYDANYRVIIPPYDAKDI